MTDRAEYRQIDCDRPLYSSVAWAYDALVRKPVDEQCEFIVKCLTDGGIVAGMRLIDAGCGTGRYSLRLAREGYNVIGVDLSPEMITEASNRMRATGCSSDFLNADLSRFKLVQPADGAICRGILNDLIEDSLRQAVLTNIARNIRKGGVFVGDVRHWAKSLEEKTAEPLTLKTAQIGGKKISMKSETVTDENSQTLLITETISIDEAGEANSTCYRLKMRCWTEKEIVDRLSTAGFESVRLFGDHRHDSRPGDTSKIWFVARR
jgi:2-polyprenyl-3-methyl-5-hydroxy-6-metoxy-1,4-benzoquinol methylase